MFCKLLEVQLQKERSLPSFDVSEASPIPQTEFSKANSIAQNQQVACDLDFYNQELFVVLRVIMDTTNNRGSLMD
jgi:hypothetical protein